MIIVFHLLYVICNKTSLATPGNIRNNEVKITTFGSMSCIAIQNTWKLFIILTVYVTYLSTLSEELSINIMTKYENVEKRYIICLFL